MSELDKLEQYLKEKGIEYERKRRLEEKEESIIRSLLDKDWGETIIVYENGERIWDAICGYGSYGYEQGLLEVMGDRVVLSSDGDSVCGFLTAEDIINRLEKSEVEE